MLVVLVVVLSVVWLGACAPQGESTMEETVNGEQLLQDSCTKCHNLDRVTNKQWDRDRWEQVVDNMIQKGAEVSNRDALVDYLAENYGP
jgi:hypothetical protein